MRFISCCIVMVLFVCACTPSTTYPVSGQMRSTQEAFTGTTTAYLDGKSFLTLQSDQGRSCEGFYVFFRAPDGPGVYKGVLNCDEGSSGIFEIVFEGKVGNGTGQIDGRDFTFSYTLPETWLD